MIKTRGIEILKSLTDREEGLFVDDISKMFGVSNRMIRYDIDSINYFLESHDINKIIKKQNAPIKLVLSNNEKEKLFEIIKEVDANTYILSSDERIAIIIYELLTSRELCKYVRLQKILCVSRSTIVSDLKRVKAELSKYNILLEKFSNKGIKINSSESDVRTCLRDLLVGSDKCNVLDILDKIYNKKSFCNVEEDVNVSTKNIEQIKDVIRDLESDIGMLTDDGFMNLVISSFVIVNRANYTEQFNNEYSISKEEYKNEYNIANKLMNKLKDRFNIIIKEENIEYLATRIIGITKKDEEIFDFKNYGEASTVGERIIKNIDLRLGYCINMDSDLYNSFLKHIEGLILRLKYNIEIKNDMVEDIKSNYFQEFCIVDEACSFLWNTFNRKISDSEIAYITLYIVASIEKIQNSIGKKDKNILVVCSSGFATSRLIEYKIKDRFSANKIEVTSVHNIDKYINRNNIDLIISTVKINKEICVPIVNVSSMFSENDINKLKEHLDYKIDGGKYRRNDLIHSDILDLINQTCEIREKERLINGLKNILSRNDNKSICIKDYIKIDDIQLNIEVDSWEEAIIKSATPILNREIINEAYIKDMIKNIKQYGAYIIVDDGIAMPHAKANNNVNGVGVTITTFKKGISILNSKPVKLFITIANNKYDHIELISALMKIIENEKLVEGIINSNEVNDVYNMIYL